MEDMRLLNHSNWNTTSKAALLLRLKEFEASYRKDVNDYEKWFNKTIVIRKKYLDLFNKFEREKDYLAHIMNEIENHNFSDSINIERFALNSQHEIEIIIKRIEQRHINKDRINQEIRLIQSEIKACEHQYNSYTKMINDSMLENRRKERLSYLASYSIDYLEIGCKSIEFNNNRNFSYHSYFEIPSEGIIGDKKFAFEEVKFVEEDIQKFLNEYFGYDINQYNIDNALIRNKTFKNKFVPKVNKKSKNQLVKETFAKVYRQKSNKNKTKTEVLHLVAEKLNMKFDATKYNFYSKPKKLAK